LQPIWTICLQFLHAGSEFAASPRRAVRRSLFRMRRVRLVLSVDKTEVEQCLRQLSCCCEHWRRCRGVATFFFCRQKRVRVEPARFPSLVNLERKIRIVVIVNAGRTVDNRDFFYMLKGLRAVLPVGQTLRLDRIETGQKNGARRTRQFRTFDPVDIQQLIHKARPIRLTSRRCRVANASGVGLFFFKNACRKS
jgi:hypothetical protein